MPLDVQTHRAIRDLISELQCISENCEQAEDNLERAADALSEML